MQVGLAVTATTAAVSTTAAGMSAATTGCVSTAATGMSAANSCVSTTTAGMSANGCMSAANGVSTTSSVIAATAARTTATVVAATAMESAAVAAVISAATIAGEAVTAPAMTVAPIGPWTNAEENPVVEVARTVVSVGCAAVWRVAVIAVLADRRATADAYANGDLSFCLGCHRKRGKYCCACKEEFECTHVEPFLRRLGSDNL